LTKEKSSVLMGRERLKEQMKEEKTERTERQQRANGCREGERDYSEISRERK